MKFNVSLDKEQLNEIASITADKVLETVRYTRNREEWLERDIDGLKIEVQRRDSMIVQKDLLIDRLQERLKKAGAELSSLKGREIID